MTEYRNIPEFEGIKKNFNIARSVQHKFLPERVEEIYQKDFKSQRGSKNLRHQGLIQFSDQIVDKHTKEKIMNNLRRWATKEELSAAVEERLATASRPVCEAIKEALTEAELIIFLDAKEELLRDYRDLNRSSDDMMLNVLIFEKIYQIRLFKSQRSNPDVDITDLYERSCTRQMRLVRSLGLRRIDRTPLTDEDKKRRNMVALRTNFSDPDKLKERVRKRDEEIAAFIKRVTERSKSEQ